MPLRHRQVVAALRSPPPPEALPPAPTTPLRAALAGSAIALARGAGLITTGFVAYDAPLGERGSPAVLPDLKVILMGPAATAGGTVLAAGARAYFQALPQPNPRAGRIINAIQFGATASIGLCLGLSQRWREDGPAASPRPPPTGSSAAP